MTCGGTVWYLPLTEEVFDRSHEMFAALTDLVFGIGDIGECHNTEKQQ